MRRPVPGLGCGNWHPQAQPRLFGEHPVPPPAAATPRPRSLPISFLAVMPCSPNCQCIEWASRCSLPLRMLTGGRNERPGAFVINHFFNESAYKAVRSHRSLSLRVVIVIHTSVASRRRASFMFLALVFDNAIVFSLRCLLDRTCRFRPPLVRRACLSRKHPARCRPSPSFKSHKQRE